MFNPKARMGVAFEIYIMGVAFAMDNMTEKKKTFKHPMWLLT